MKKIGVLSLALLLAFAVTAWAQNARLTNGPNVQWVRGDSAEITWTTSENTGGYVLYGTDPNNLNQTAHHNRGPSRGQNGEYQHVVQLTGLQPNTTYYYKITSTGGATLESSVQQFRTEGGGSSASGANQAQPYYGQGSMSSGGRNQATQVMAPSPDWQRIATDGPNVQWVRADRAQVAWSTDKPTSGQDIVRYGTDPNNLSMTAYAQQDRTERNRDILHKAELTGLQPNTTYYFRVESQGVQGGGMVASGMMQFRTENGGGGGMASSSGQMSTWPGNQQSRQGQSIHITNGPNVEKTSATTAQIAWSTNVQGSSMIRYGTDRSSLNQVAEGAWGGSQQQTGGFTHRVTIQGLRPSTTYFFQVESTPASGTGTQARSNQMQFRTDQSSSAHR